MTSLYKTKADPFVSENFSLTSNKDIRLGFIRKVYGILTTQMLITIVFCFFACIGHKSHPLREFEKYNHNHHINTAAPGLLHGY